ncbi:hypothetical protein ANANG_G00287310 [Anguilla anguilla]|uniref:Ubinuclein middle domain-containing protein n=1 Tax=Anguilla anguilla TaxID=7936 RepID=A0A9D3RIX6_ANGAN|nr:hypothetical protein ANANG_G00287310 [Anguilla anguilla]
MSELTADPAVMSLLGSANESEMLQDLMGELDFGVLDSPQACSPAQGENGLAGAGAGQKAGSGVLGKAQATSLLVPPPLPDNLPAPLLKRIDDLRLQASRQFDQEGRKKFFTLDMNSILLDIELQVQEQPAAVRSAVYSHLEAFVPCNKEVLLKRLKKLSLNVQDDRLRAPLLKLKLAVCSVMPEQITRYNMDCIARVAKQQSEEVEKNGSEEDDEEKPGKRVMGPRKKFLWDDKLRTLLCSVVRVKLGCYELESQCSLSVEDYLKAFLETEVKPLWPKGWMQARILFKESRSVHSHLFCPIQSQEKDGPRSKIQTQGGRLGPEALPSPLQSQRPAVRPPPPPRPSACRTPGRRPAPALPDSISHALALLSSAAKGLIQDRPASPKPSHPPAGRRPRPPSAPRPLPARVLSCGVRDAEGRGSPLPGAEAPQTHARQPAFPALNKLQSSSPPLPPKPRPPPTSSPLVPPAEGLLFPGVKQGMRPGLSTPPSGLDKGSGKASSSSNGSMGVPPQCRPSALPSPQPSPSVPQTSRPHQTPHLRTPPQASPRPRRPLQPRQAPPRPLPSSSQTPPHQQQSSFITPMQVTLSKSSHSSNPSIIKLSPRPPAPLPPSSSSSSSPLPPFPLPPTVHPEPAPTLFQELRRPPPSLCQGRG